MVASFSFNRASLKYWTQTGLSVRIKIAQGIRNDELLNQQSEDRAGILE